MAFVKAKAQQAKFKAGLYGKQGTGKTFTALLFAEGLAAMEGKRIAYVDTELGTDFYASAVPERKVHPEAFDFDRIVTRSIMDVVQEVSELDPAVHGVLVIDSITHLWEATMNAYSGKRMANGQIPVHAWGPIKKPYKQLMSLFLDGNFHAILCGRQGINMQENEDGEMEFAGTKLKAEGDTGHEPHILIRMSSEWQRDGSFQICAFTEKDRSGILTGKKIPNPDFETIRPILRYLSAETQGKLGSADATAESDAAKIQEQAERAEAERKQTYETIRSAILTASSVDALKVAWELTKGKKGKLGDLWEQLEAAKNSRKAELAVA